MFRNLTACFTYIIKFIVRGIITFLNKGADMLQKAFFKVDVVDRIYDTPVFVKTTPGAYEFTVPEEYNYVVIEYAGAGGGDGYGAEGTLVAKGRGGVLKIQKTKIKNFTINGIVASVGGAPNGGTGYNNGQNGTVVEGCSGGGGGGSRRIHCCI